MGAIVGGEAPPRPAAALAREAREAREAAQAAAAAAEAAEAAAAAAAREQVGVWRGATREEQLQHKVRAAATPGTLERSSLLVSTKSHTNTLTTRSNAQKTGASTAKSIADSSSTARSTSPRQCLREKP